MGNFKGNLFKGNLEPFQGIFRESFQGDFPEGDIYIFIELFIKWNFDTYNHGILHYKMNSYADLS